MSLNLQALWDLAKELGPGGIVLLLYWCWRQDRKLDKQDNIIQRLLVNYDRALNKSADAMRSVNTTLGRREHRTRRQQ